MKRRVLIVDDNQKILLSLKEGLESYSDTFKVLTADDGLKATEMLKSNPISLVVTDLKMPRMDGFALLAHIVEEYPDIPVIIITGYSTPEMEKLARKGGAIGYVEKPFIIEDMARKIMTTLRKEAEGGSLHGVSSGMFLQLVEMEQKTCTIRLMDKQTGKQGVLFFRDGDLLDARSDGLRAEKAAYEIFSWDEVSLSIQNTCPQRQKKIQSELYSILLEAKRLKDEASQTEEPVMEPVTDPSDGRDLVETICSKLQKQIGERCGLQKIYQDDAWSPLILEVQRVGSIFDAGEFKLGYIDRGESEDFIFLPGEKTTVISVDHRCPRDRIIDVLSG